MFCLLGQIMNLGVNLVGFPYLPADEATPPNLLSNSIWLVLQSPK